MEIWLIHFPDAWSIEPMQLLVSFNSIEELKRKLARAGVQALRRWEGEYVKIGCTGPEVAVENLNTCFLQERKDYYVVTPNGEKTTSSLLSR